MLKTLPKSIKDISKLIFGNVAIKIIGIGMLIFYARTLTKQEMAIFPVYFMLSDLASLVLSFGIFPTFIKRLPSLFIEDITQAKKMIFTGSMIVILGTVLVSGFVYFFSVDVTQVILKNVVSPQLVRIMTIGFVALSVMKVADHILWAKRCFGKKTILAVLESILRPCSTVAFYLLYGIKGVVVGLVLSQILLAVVSLFFIRDVLLVRLMGFCSMKELLKESLPFYLESYLMYFRREGDNWLVSTMLGAETLSVYYIAKTVYTTFFMFYSSVDQVTTERLAQSMGDLQVLKKNVQELHRTLVQTTIPVFLLSVSLLPIAVPLIAGGQYSGAIIPASILLFALLVQFLRIPISRTIFVAARPRDRLVSTLIDSLVLLPSLVVFTPVFGVEGVAGARLFAQLMGGIWGLWYVNKKMRISFGGNVVALSVITSVPGTFLCLIFQKDLHLVNPVLFRIIILISCWLLLFLSLTYWLNRSLFDQLNKFVSGRITNL